MVEGGRDLRPRLDPECRRPLLGAEAEQRTYRDDVPLAGRPPRGALELPQLLERIDADVRVRADADPDPALAQRRDGDEAVAEVRLGGRADTHARPRVA